MQKSEGTAQRFNEEKKRRKKKEVRETSQDQAKSRNSKFPCSGHHKSLSRDKTKQRKRQSKKKAKSSVD